MGKYIKSNKGSTLLLVLVITAVLTVFGTALISMSVMSTNMRNFDIRSKRALYYTESGLEQLYAHIGVLVEETLLGNGTDYIGAVALTRNQISEKLNNIILDMEQEPDALGNPPVYLFPTYHVEDIVTGDRVLIPNIGDVLKAEADDLFNTNYKTYFNARINNHLTAFQYGNIGSSDGNTVTLNSRSEEHTSELQSRSISK